MLIIEIVLIHSIVVLQKWNSTRASESPCRLGVLCQITHHGLEVFQLINTFTLLLDVFSLTPLQLGNLWVFSRVLLLQGQIVVLLLHQHVDLFGLTSLHVHPDLLWLPTSLLPIAILILSSCCVSWQAEFLRSGLLMVTYSTLLSVQVSVLDLAKVHLG